MELLDGRKISQEILKELKTTLSQKNLRPYLAIILVGQDPASLVYVNQKKKKGEEIGIKVEIFSYSEASKQEEIEQKILELNRDKAITGMIVQLPLPKHLYQAKLLNLVSLEKDVDGLAENSPFRPATPLGIIELLKRSQVVINDKKAVVVGYSDLVGKPVSEMLKEEGADVEVVDIDTPNPEKIISTADLLVVAVGKPKFIRKAVLKKGVVVVDVGINRTEEGLVGDVDFEDVQGVVAKITPVPGGVGPMTVTMLLKNVVAASSLVA